MTSNGLENITEKTKDFAPQKKTGASEVLAVPE